MKMLENLKKKIARHLIKKRYLSRHDKSVAFNKIVSDSLDFLVVMPANDDEFIHSAEVLRYLLIHKKNVSLFIPEHKINVLSDKSRFKCIPYVPSNITRFFLPDDRLSEELGRLAFDVVIDLNRKENVFLSAAANIVDSNCRIGFSREFSEKLYNLQVVNSSENPEIAFRNFLNFLKMF